MKTEAGYVKNMFAYTAECFVLVRQLYSDEV